MELAGEGGEGLGDGEGGDGLGDGERRLVEGVVLDGEGIMAEGVLVGGEDIVAEGVLVGGEDVVAEGVVLDIGLEGGEDHNRDHLLGQLSHMLHRGNVLGEPVGGNAVNAGHAETVVANDSGHCPGSAAGQGHQGNHVAVHVGWLGVVGWLSRYESGEDVS